MMLSLNGQDSEYDAYEFYLAEKLSRTVEELHETMSSAEYIEWQSYQKAMNASTTMKAVT